MSTPISTPQASRCNSPDRAVRAISMEFDKLKFQMQKDGGKGSEGPEKMTNGTEKAFRLVNGK
eukprot:1592636-Karenia_brevis.AAC.1